MIKVLLLGIAVFLIYVLAVLIFSDWFGKRVDEQEMGRESDWPDWPDGGFAA